MTLKDHDPIKNGQEETLAHVTEEIKEKLGHATTQTVAYVKKHPIKAMGLTLLAGIVIAQLMRLRK